MRATKTASRSSAALARLARTLPRSPRSVLTSRCFRTPDSSAIPLTVIVYAPTTCPATPPFQTLRAPKHRAESRWLKIRNQAPVRVLPTTVSPLGLTPTFVTRRAITLIGLESEPDIDDKLVVRR